MGTPDGWEQTDAKDPEKLPEIDGGWGDGSWALLSPFTPFMPWVPFPAGRAQYACKWLLRNAFSSDEETPWSGRGGVTRAGGTIGGHGRRAFADWLDSGIGGCWREEQETMLHSESVLAHAKPRPWHELSPPKMWLQGHCWEQRMVGSIFGKVWLSQDEYNNCIFQQRSNLDFLSQLVQQNLNNV